MSIRLGDLPTWVAAIGTVGTLGVSLGVLARDVGRQRLQTDKLHKQEQERLQAERRAQASKVGAWVEISGGSSGGSNPTQVSLKLHVANTSDQPIYNVHFMVAVLPHQIHPTPTPSDISAVQQGYPAVPPHTPDTTYSAAFYISEPWATSAAQLTDEGLTSEFSFTDSSGVSWVRTHRGRLLERGEPPWTEMIHLSLVERAAAFDEGH